MTLVLPGDTVPLPSTSSLTLGPGISASSSRSTDPYASTSDASSSSFIATRLGVLSSQKGKGKDTGESYWVDGRSRRYIPAQKELVLGTVIARHSEGFRVDLGSSQMASLDALAFEGATKRSKPNLKVGMLVYARVALANRDMETEIECFDPTTGKAEGFGELKGGLMINTSLEFARQLLTPKHPLLPALAAQFPYEIAVGMNGRVWFKAAEIGQTIAIKRVLESVEKGEVGMSKEEVGGAIREYTA